jgi:hypothetical protein
MEKRVGGKRLDRVPIIRVALAGGQMCKNTPQSVLSMDLFQAVMAREAEGALFMIMHEHVCVGLGD